MTDITDEQRAAWQRIEAGSPRAALVAADLALIVPLLPADLTDPQPVLPTEPGLYASHTDPDAAWKLHSDGDWWPPYQDYAVGIAEVHSAAPFTRLVRERPEITREQIEECAETSRDWDGTVNNILALVNGTDRD